MGGGRSFFGAVASQIIFDRLRSTGNMEIASKNIAKNAMKKISNIAAETRIASTMMGICAPVNMSNDYLYFEYTR